MNIQLVVKHPFLSHAVGDVITDEELVAKYVKTHFAHVVKVIKEAPVVVEVEDVVNH